MMKMMNTLHIFTLLKTFLTTLPFLLFEAIFLPTFSLWSWWREWRKIFIFRSHHHPCKRINMHRFIFVPCRGFVLRWRQKKFSKYVKNHLFEKFSKLILRILIKFQQFIQQLQHPRLHCPLQISHTTSRWKCHV